MKKPKVSIAIPLQQHSYKTAEALVHDDMLQNYYTTVYYNGDHFLYRMLGRLLNKDLKIRMAGRYNSIFNDYVCKYNQIIGLAYLFIIRKDKNLYVLPKIKRVMNYLFGKKVARVCNEKDTDILIMYDTLAFDCFKELNRKKSKIIKVLDMASISAPYIREIILRELKSDDMFKDSLNLRLKSYTQSICNLYQREILNSDYFLVACNYAKKTLIDLGIDESRIFYLPLGVNVNNPNQINHEKKIFRKKMKFLFVGRVEAAKGIFYLFEAFNKLKDYDIELDVVGAIKCDMSLLERYGKNVNFLGLKRKDEMTDIYAKADIYILSSLWEGFSLSLFEALSFGLPVIASKFSCAPDVITEYKEGFVVDPTDIDQLINRILWFYENRPSINAMSINAINLAQKYSWNSYGERLSDIMHEIMNR